MQHSEQSHPTTDLVWLSTMSIGAKKGGAHSLSIEQSIIGWLHQMQHSRSQSMRTVDAYREIISEFRAALAAAGLDLDSEAHLVRLTAQGWLPMSKDAHKRMVAPSTQNLRRAIISSFYKYAQLHGAIEQNPMDGLPTVKVGVRDMAQPLQADDVAYRLGTIDQNTLEGARDYALLSLALTTGRRVSELAALRMGDITISTNGSCQIVWRRCKGGDPMDDLLPTSTAQVMVRYLERIDGDLRVTPPSPEAAAVWVSTSDANYGAAIGGRAISAIWKKRLGTGKVHTTRHTHALRAYERGATVQQIGAQLGHRHLSTTISYMDDLQARSNPYGTSLEQAFGIE